MDIASLGALLSSCSIHILLIRFKFDQVDGITDKCWLDYVVDIGLHRHRWARVDLQQPWLHVSV